MNKLIITIISTLLLTAAGTAIAQKPAGEPGRKTPNHQRGMQAMPAVEKLIRAVRHLDLTDEQRAGVRAVMQGLKQDVRPIMMETKAGYEQLQKLVKAASYNEEAVAALAQKEGDLVAERVMITSQALSKIYNLLTDEQRTELEAMAAKRMARRTERRERKKPETD